MSRCSSATASGCVDARRRVNRLPLGAAALAGTTFPIDRAFVAQRLGFEAIAENSLDAVSDRDFAIEFAAAAALLMVHVSRLAEELVLWMSPRFGFVRLPDRFTTGSSIMPQKKNPDVAGTRARQERARHRPPDGAADADEGPAARLQQGQPGGQGAAVRHGRHRDWTRLRAFVEMVPGIEVDAAAMRRAAAEGYSTATDLADYLVRKGLPFREAHEAVARAVRLAASRGVELAALTAAELQACAGLMATTSRAARPRRLGCGARPPRRDRARPRCAGRSLDGKNFWRESLAGEP